MRDRQCSLGCVAKLTPMCLFSAPGILVLGVQLDSLLGAMEDR